jgi:hypothetical protein
MFVKGDYVFHIEDMFQKARSKGQSEQTVSHAQKRVVALSPPDFMSAPKNPT